MPPFKSFFSFALITGAASASAIIPRQSLPCNPNFESHRVSVTNSAVEWGAPPISGAKVVSFRFSNQEEWLWEQVGSPSPQYIAKFADTDLVATAYVDGSVVLSPQSNDINQRWLVHCELQCKRPSELTAGFGVSAEGCSIRSAATGQCVTTQGQKQGEVLFLSNCHDSQDQNFNFFLGDPVAPTTFQAVPTITGDPTISTTSFVSTIVSSAPLPSPSTCNPDYADFAVSIANSAVLWGVPDGSDKLTAQRSGTRELYAIEQLGFGPDIFYVIRSTNTSSVAVSLSPDTSLAHVPININDSNQHFIIECARDCAAGGFFIGDGCNVRPRSDHSKCVQIGTGPEAGSAGDSIFATTCDGTDSQRYNFPSEGRVSSPQTSTSSTTISAPSGTTTRCNPELEKVAAEIANSAIIWSADESDNLVAQKGDQAYVFDRVQSGGKLAYVIKPSNDTSKAVTSRSDGTLGHETLQSGNVNQHFLIECASDCAAGGFFTGDNCNVNPISDLHQCVQIGSGPIGEEGDAIFLKWCDGLDSQRYNFPVVKSVPASGNANVGGQVNSVSGAINDNDSENQSLDLKTLIRNSYVVIGLLGAVLLGFIVMVLSMMFGKGCLRGREVKYSRAQPQIPELKALYAEGGESDVPRYRD